MNHPAQTPRVRVVAGVDLRDPGKHALGEALLLASSGAVRDLHVVHVISTDPGLHDARRLDELSGLLRTKLDELRSHVTEHFGAAPGSGISQHTALHVRLGEPAAAIHQLAVDVDADLIIVGADQQTSTGAPHRESVAEQLVKTARVPVLVAHAKNFRGLAKSAHLEPARPGQDMHPQGLTAHVHLEFVPRTTHIAGMGWP